MISGSSPSPQNHDDMQGASDNGLARSITIFTTLELARFEEQKALFPLTGKRAFGVGDEYQSSRSEVTAGALRLKSLAGRTFFSPGNGNLNPVDSYQS